MSAQDLRSRPGRIQGVVTGSVAVVCLRDVSGQRREVVGVDSGGRMLDLRTESGGRPTPAGVRSFVKRHAERLQLAEVVFDSALLLGLVGTTGYGSGLT